MNEPLRMPDIPRGALTEEQIEKISGGSLLECSPGEINEIIANLQQNYDALVSFTSYVIETVATSLSNP